MILVTYTPPESVARGDFRSGVWAIAVAGKSGVQARLICPGAMQTRGVDWGPVPWQFV